MCEGRAPPPTNFWVGKALPLYSYQGGLFPQNDENWGVNALQTYQQTYKYIHTSYPYEYFYMVIGI